MSNIFSTPVLNVPPKFRVHTFEELKQGIVSPDNGLVVGDFVINHHRDGVFEIVEMQECLRDDAFDWEYGYRIHRGKYLPSDPVPAGIQLVQGYHRVKIKKLTNGNFTKVLKKRSITESYTNWLEYIDKNVLQSRLDWEVNETTSRYKTLMGLLP